MLDRRRLLFVPYNKYGNSKICELLANGTGVERSDTVGDVFKWVRVR